MHLTARVQRHDVLPNFPHARPKHEGDASVGDRFLEFGLQRGLHPLEPFAAMEEMNRGSGLVGESQGGFRGTVPASDDYDAAVAKRFHLDDVVEDVGLLLAGNAQPARRSATAHREHDP